MNIFRLPDEQQVREVAKMCGFDPNADLKDLPTAQLRNLIRKTEDYAYRFLLGEIIKMMGNKKCLK